MNSSLIITLEFIGVVGVVFGLAIWELLRLRRDRARDDEAAPTPTPATPPRRPPDAEASDP